MPETKKTEAAKSVAAIKTPVATTAAKEAPKPAAKKPAVKKAAELAKTEKYYTSSYPGKVSWKEQLIGEMSSSGGNYLDARLREYLGAYYEPFMLMKNINKESAIQARVPFVLNLK